MFVLFLLITKGLYCKEMVKNKQCRDAKVTDTFIPEKTQKNKDFQDNENNTIVKLRAAVRKGSCKEILTKLACASYTPPCKEDGHKMESLCRSKCLELSDDCPEAFMPNISEVAAYCAVAPREYADGDFCYLKRWPSAELWDVGEKKYSWNINKFLDGIGYAGQHCSIILSDYLYGYIEKCCPM